MRPGGIDRTVAAQDALRSRLGIAAFLSLTLALLLGVVATIDRAERQNPFAAHAHQN